MSGAEFDPFASLPIEDVAKLHESLADTSALKVKIPGVPDVAEAIPGSSLPRFPKDRPAPPLEEYVAEHVEAAKRLVAGGLKDPRQFTEKTEGDDRVSRAEAYARWRWQGYKDGEIASL